MEKRIMLVLAGHTLRVKRREQNKSTSPGKSYGIRTPGGCSPCFIFYFAVNKLMTFFFNS